MTHPVVAKILGICESLTDDELPCGSIYSGIYESLGKNIPLPWNESSYDNEYCPKPWIVQYKSYLEIGHPVVKITGCCESLGTNITLK